ncbi:hypothetical protein ACHAW6_013497 [Cyclotella cf. meneghiniana]
MFQIAKSTGNDNPHPLHCPIIPSESDIAVAMMKVEQSAAVPRKKRICRYPGCANLIKSHGRCQKHGAKPKRCKVPGCEAQRQSGYDDMCKRHWRYLAAPPEMRRVPPKTSEEKRMVEPQGKSVYDDILPASFAWKGGLGASDSVSNHDGDPPYEPEDYDVEYTQTLPLAKFLEDNSHLEAGWHRRNECLARGLMPPTSLKCKLEVWEKQIAITEMALLVGFNDEYQRMLAHAWGRDQNQFGKHLIGILCSRRGELARKRRSDFGSKLPEEKRAKASEKALATKKLRQEEVGQKKQQQGQENEESNQSFEENDTAKLSSINKDVQHDSEAHMEAKPVASLEG